MATNIGMWIEIHCFKHDGKLHRAWDRGLIVYNDEDYLIVASKRAKVVEANGRKWFTKEPAVTVFSKKDWFNAICMFKEDGVCYYVNIASPAILDKKTIKYIDYDLDVKLFPDNSIRVLDEKEYIYNKKKYNYSSELDEILTFKLKKIQDMIKRRDFPFVDAKIHEFYKQYLEKTSKNG